MPYLYKKSVRGIQVSVKGEIDYEIEKSIESLGEEVQGLAKQYYDEICQIPLLTKEEEQQLVKRKTSGDNEARKCLIESNLRLVLWVITHHYRGITSMEFLDLIQEGNLGLMKGIDKMDPSKNCRIATYVPYYIRSQISYALTKNRSKLSHSHSMGILIEKIRKKEMQYQLECGHRPTQEQLAETLNLSLKKVKEVYRTITPMVELDALSPTLGEPNGELIGHPQELNPEEEYMKKVEHDMLYGLLEHFSERDKELIILFLGLKDGICHTERDLAERFQITTSRVGQIKDKLKRYQNDPKVQRMFEDHITSLPMKKSYQKKR